MPAYTWVVSGTVTRELTEARGRRLDFAVEGAATATFNISGLSEEAAAIVEFESDLTVYRDGDKIFRGRILGSQDAVTESSHTVTFAAKDYRGLLEYRSVQPTGLTWSGVDQAEIAWDLVEHTQTKTAGALGITNGLGQTSGQTRVRTIAGGTTISEAIVKVGRLQNGFEWEIDPELALNRWFPRRGSDNGVRLDYGGLLSSFTRTQSTDFANVAQVQGSPETVAVEETSVDLATDPRGRWEVSVGYPTVKEQDTLDERALWVLGETATLRPGYSAIITLGRWEGRSHIWLGDLVQLQAKNGRLNVNSQQRVVTVGLQLDEHGSETVYLGLIDSGA